MRNDIAFMFVAFALFLLAAVASWQNATPMTMVGRTDAGVALPVSVDSNGELIISP